jgi:hypothetical protein
MWGGILADSKTCCPAHLLLCGVKNRNRLMKRGGSDGVSVDSIRKEEGKLQRCNYKKGHMLSFISSFFLS